MKRPPQQQEPVQAGDREGKGREDELFASVTVREPAAWMTVIEMSVTMWSDERPGIGGYLFFHALIRLKRTISTGISRIRSL